MTKGVDSNSVDGKGTVTRDEKGRIVSGTLNPGGRIPEKVREFHAAFRERLPQVFAILDKWLASGDPELEEKAVQYVCKYGVPVPQMKGAERDNADMSAPRLTPEELRQILAALRSH